MKVRWNKKYTTIAIYSLIVLCLSIGFYQIISQATNFKLKILSYLKVFTPFIIGFVMAYLFNFILEFYEYRIKKTYKRKSLNVKEGKRNRVLSIILTYVTVIIIIYIFSNFVFPQIISSLKGIINNIPNYIDYTYNILEGINEKLALEDEYAKMIMEKWDSFMAQAITFATNLIPMFANMIKSILSSIWNLVLGIIVSIYLLFEKERFLALSHKITRGIFSEERANWLIKIAKRANYIFSRFLGGKILDSTIIGILTFGVLKVFKIPYPILVAFIVGLTNIIPFFGPFIGAIPSSIIIFFESPIKSLWFIVIILVIQQIDGNIIGPKILGDSLGISAFWILFSLLITGKLLGFIGLVIGVPLFTLIYSIIKDLIEKRLEDKGLPVETEDYMK